MSSIFKGVGAEEISKEKGSQTIRRGPFSGSTRCLSIASENKRHNCKAIGTVP